MVAGACKHAAGGVAANTHRAIELHGEVPHQGEPRQDRGAPEIEGVQGGHHGGGQLASVLISSFLGLHVPGRGLEDRQGASRVGLARRIDLGWR